MGRLKNNFANPKTGEAILEQKGTEAAEKKCSVFSVSSVGSFGVGAGND